MRDWRGFGMQGALVNGPLTRDSAGWPTIKMHGVVFSVRYRKKQDGMHVPLPYNALQELDEDSSPVLVALRFCSRHFQQDRINLAENFVQLSKHQGSPCQVSPLFEISSLVDLGHYLSEAPWVLCQKCYQKQGKERTRDQSWWQTWI